MRYYLLLIYISGLLLSAASCGKKPAPPEPVAPIDQLPPYTETGAQTFGCLIDGKAFLPKRDPSIQISPLACEYQYVSGTQYFTLYGLNGDRKSEVIINSVNIDLEEKIYELGNYYTDSISGRYAKYHPINNFIIRDPLQKGELHIRHFDLEHQIVSGTFWFDAVDTLTGKIVQVREGRFDMVFIR